MAVDDDLETSHAQRINNHDNCQDTQRLTEHKLMDVEFGSSVVKQARSSKKKRLLLTSSLRPSAPIPLPAPVPVPVPSGNPVSTRKRGNGIGKRRKFARSKKRAKLLASQEKAKAKAKAKASANDSEVEDKDDRLLGKREPNGIECEKCRMRVPEDEYIEHIEAHFEEVEKVFNPEQYLPRSEDELPHLRYKKSKGHAECCICMVRFKRGERLLYLPCTHYYHDQCINDWIHKHPIDPCCPFCQYKIFRTKPSEISA